MEQSLIRLLTSFLWQYGRQDLGEHHRTRKRGLLHLDFIKEHRKGRYTTLVSECRLNEYLHKIDLEASEMLETIVLRLATEGGIDENLKARDMLRWVGEMNNIKASAEEIVLQEEVYQ